MNINIHSIHKALSVYSSILNGYSVLQYFAENTVNSQFTGLKTRLPDGGIIGDTVQYISNLNWYKLGNGGNLKSVEGLCKSGVLGLLELRFSEDITGTQTTHFGAIYPTLNLLYGDNWHTNGNVAIGVAAVAAIEIAYWYANKENNNSHETESIRDIIHDEIQELKDIHLLNKYHSYEYFQDELFTCK